MELLPSPTSLGPPGWGAGLGLRSLAALTWPSPGWLYPFSTTSAPRAAGSNTRRWRTATTCTTRLSTAFSSAWAGPKGPSCRARTPRPTPSSCRAGTRSPSSTSTPPGRCAGTRAAPRTTTQTPTRWTCWSLGPVPAPRWPPVPRSCGAPRTVAQRSATPSACSGATGATLTPGGWAWSGAAPSLSIPRPGRKESFPATFQKRKLSFKGRLPLHAEDGKLGSVWN